MVCSLGSGRMEVMARLLSAGSFSQSNPEEVDHQKFISQFIHRELCEADEANLLDEEDMHVFDLRPMEDPLHLVCCNACKKPVKASQYAAHAGLDGSYYKFHVELSNVFSASITEFCRSLSSTEESVLEADGGTGHKKPPRKEKRKLPNQGTIAREHEKPKYIQPDNNASVPQLDEQAGTTFSFSMEAKRHSGCVDVAPKMDSSGFSPQFTDHSAGVPPTKRSKLIAAEHLPLSADLETACGLTKIISQGAYTCREFPKGSIAAFGKCYGHVASHYNGHVLGCCLPTKDIPVPLATKMYYSQRSHRLRSALSLMYHEASPNEYCSNLVIPKMLQGSLMPPQASSPKNFSNEETKDQPKKKRESLPDVPNPNQTLAQSSETCLGKAGGCPPDKNFSSQFPVNNIMRPHTAPVGLLRSKYRSKSYSFAGNSGTSLGTLQQPNESVPVT